MQWPNFSRIFNRHFCCFCFFNIFTATTFIIGCQNLVRKSNPRFFAMRTAIPDQLRNQSAKKNKLAGLGKAKKILFKIKNQCTFRKNGAGPGDLDQLQSAKNSNRVAIARAQACGFAVVGFIALAPLLFALMTAISVFGWYVRESTRLKSICENHLFYYSFLLSEQMNDLQKLNAPAAKLRAQYKKAQLSLQVALATGNAVRIATAEAKLVQVTFARAALAQKQKQIFIFVEIQRMQNQINTNRALQKNILQINNKSAGGWLKNLDTN